MSYDPGTAQPIRVVNAAEQIFAVDSFRGEGSSYLINLKQNTCTCPHFQQRLKGQVDADGQQLECKHLTAARDQKRWLETAAQSKKLKDAELDFWIQWHQTAGNEIEAGAVRCERHRRLQVAAEQTMLKAVFS